MKDELILQLLREDPSDFLSGEEMSRRLGVTRTSIWKEVRRLREMGYGIEASTRSGYRLVRSPDRLSPAEVRPLHTRWMGKTIHYFDALDSTNSKAYQLASEGAEEGEVVVAECQKKGKGRLARNWFSPPFVNLYLSVILRPKTPPHQISLITLMAAVAAADAIQKFAGLHPTIKWPNDLLVNGRKLAGLLNEIHSEIDRVHFVVLGIGVNLNADIRTFPSEVRAKATSLKNETGRAVSRKDFLRVLLQELERWYEVLEERGGAPILQAWRERARIEGKRLKVTSFRQTVTGHAVDIDSDGALLLRTRNGTQRRIVAGDVEYLIS